MIKSKKEYEHLVNWYGNTTFEWKDIFGTIEALHTVARAAHIVSRQFAHEKGSDLYKLDIALATLEPWMLEAE